MNADSVFNVNSIGSSIKRLWACCLVIGLPDFLLGNSAPNGYLAGIGAVLF
ncbi:hypothetical protein [Sporomusa malonica]|uniref:hypothetical protein n=1 Tax=Sporomusa malonica TaxID=112901 RepID=UPI001593A9A8|nr:hypothetical protein [Sporomusa malonica]